MTKCVVFPYFVQLLTTLYECVRGNLDDINLFCFTAAYKKLLMGASNLSKYGNFILQDEKKLLNLPSKTIDAVKMVENALELTETIDDRYISAAVETKSEYSDSIIPYISGFIHRKLLKKETCLSCHSYSNVLSVRQCIFRACNLMFISIHIL